MSAPGDDLARAMAIVRERVTPAHLAQLDQLMVDAHAELAQYIVIAREMYDGLGDWTLAASLALFGMTDSNWDRTYACGVAAVAVSELARAQWEREQS